MSDYLVWVVESILNDMQKDPEFAYLVAAEYAENRDLKNSKYSVERYLEEKNHES